RSPPGRQALPRPALARQAPAASRGAPRGHRAHRSPPRPAPRCSPHRDRTRGSHRGAGNRAPSHRAAPHPANRDPRHAPRPARRLAPRSRRPPAGRPHRRAQRAASALFARRRARAMPCAGDGRTRPDRSRAWTRSSGRRHNRALIVAGLAMTYPSLARRTRRIAPFRVMELVGRAAAREAAGHPVIHLSIGEPDFTAPPPVIEALEPAARAGRARYTPANGTPALRSAISHWYAERFGIDVAPARILVTAGASGALTLACAALVDPGDRVLLTDPGYPCNRHFVSAFDGEPVLVPVGPATRFQMSRSI